MVELGNMKVVLTFLNLLAIPAAILAQQADDPGRTSGYVEAGATQYVLPSEYGDFRGAYLRLAVVSRQNVMYGDVVYQNAFRDKAVYSSVGLVHDSRNWITSFFVGGGSGRVQFAELRTDASAARKWLNGRNLVTTVGMGYSNEHDFHQSYRLSTGARYYLNSHWIVEGIVRWNRSDPLHVLSRQQSLAVTYGTNQRSYLTIQGEFGREAYQQTNSGVLVDFPSKSVTVTYRKWVSTHWVLNVSPTYYTNPFYQRAGASIGVFQQW
jgi:YaiO family outer membrane protein